MREHGKGGWKAGDVVKVGNSVILLVQDGSTLKNIVLDMGRFFIGGTSGKDLANWIDHRGEKLFNLQDILVETGVICE